MDDSAWSSDEEDEKLELTPTNDFQKDPSYTLVVIDTHPDMFAKNNKNVCAFKAAIESCYAILDSLLLSSSGTQKSRLAILLATNDLSRQKFADFEDCPLEVLRLLKKLCETSTEKLKDEYSSSGKFDLGIFLINCRAKFNSIKSAIFEKSVIYVTNTDNPAGKVPAQKLKAMNEAKNYALANVRVHVITMLDTFNTVPFYKEFLEIVHAKEAINVKDAEEMADEIAPFIKVRYTTATAKFYLFKDDWKRYLQVKIHNYVSPVRLTNNAHVTKRSHEEVIKRMEGDPAPPNSYLFHFSTLHEGVALTPEENEQLKVVNDIPVGITLLYISDDKLMANEFSAARPFIFAKHPKEASLAFEIFWQYCWDKKQVVVCLQKLRKNGHIHYVQLTPKCVNKQKMFLVKRFPTRDTFDLVEENAEKVGEPSKTTENLWEAIVDKLTFEYAAETLPDVAYEKRKAYIKSELLEEDMETVNDIYDDALIDKVIAQEAKNLYREVEVPIANQKRKVSTAKPKISKRVKKEEVKMEQDASD